MRFADVLQRMSTAWPVVCALVPVRPFERSYATERYAEFKTNGIPANCLARSNLLIVPWFMFCNEHFGTHALNSDSLKYFAVIIILT